MRAALSPSSAEWVGTVPSRRRAVYNGQPEHNRRSASPLRPEIPPPPRVPAEAAPLLAQALAEGAIVDDDFGRLFEGVPVGITLSDETADAFPLEVFEVGADEDDGETISVREHEERVQELILDGNRLIEEAREARRERDRARLEADSLWSRVVQLEAQRHRTDPAWMGGGECS